MMFELECVGDFMHAFYYLGDYIYIPACALSQAWLNKIVENCKMIESNESELPEFT